MIAIGLSGCSKKQNEQTAEKTGQKELKTTDSSSVVTKLERERRRPPHLNRPTTSTPKEPIDPEALLAGVNSGILLPENWVGLPEVDDVVHKGRLASQISRPLATIPTRAEKHLDNNKRYFKRLNFRKVYGERHLPPSMNYNLDISNLSLESLILLRNEIFARHGYIFSNALIRDYFKQFDWYQPIYWEEERDFKLSKEEKELIDRIKAREEELLKENYREDSDRHLARLENVVNMFQFEAISDTLHTFLRKRNFAVNWADHDQELYHIYDRNLYHCIPNYITTDLYLRLLNVYYKYLLMEIETNELIPLYTYLIQGMNEEMLSMYEADSLGRPLREALEYNIMLLSVAESLITGEDAEVPDTLLSDFQPILDRAKAATGQSVPYLDARLFDFTQLKPRGNYTTRPELSRYFQAVKWLNSLPIHLDKGRSIHAAMLMGYVLQKDAKLAAAYNRIEELTAIFAGKGDNLSLSEVRFQLKLQATDATPATLMDVNLTETLRRELVVMDREHIRPASSSLDIQREMNRPKLIFTPTRYMFDGEILQEIMSRERPLPKALDIFAVMQGGEAKNTLLKGYKEGEKWAEYPKRVERLSKDIPARINWNESFYNKRMELIFSINSLDSRAPGFMDYWRWERRNLSTAIAAWTQLKHEMLLYTKQPVFAEAGEGGGPPPPIIPGYVEPNIAFWNKALELAEATYLFLEEKGMLTNERASNLRRCYRIADFCRHISEKELSGQHVDDREMESIMWLGGTVEHLMRRIIPDDVVDEKMQIAVDVASWFGAGENLCLEEAIGKADEIYVIAEINGRLYLTRGAVMSHYEFKQPIRDRLTDAEWRDMLNSPRQPQRPVWTRQIGRKYKSVKVKPNFGDHSDFLYSR